MALERVCFVVVVLRYLDYLWARRYSLVAMGPQNVWQFLLICFKWISAKTTRGLGVIQTSVGIIAVGGGFPDGWVKWIVIATGLLTYWRGQATSNTVDIAQTIVAQAKSTEIPLSQTIKDAQK
jgi:hypothetical protein